MTTNRDTTPRPPKAPLPSKVLVSHGHLRFESNISSKSRESKAAWYEEGASTASRTTTPQRGRQKLMCDHSRFESQISKGPKSQLGGNERGAQSLCTKKHPTPSGISTRRAHSLACCAGCRTSGTSQGIAIANGDTTAKNRQYSTACESSAKPASSSSRPSDQDHSTPRRGSPMNANTTVNS